MAINKKATKAEVIERTRQIKDLLLKGKSRSSIQQYAATNFQLSERVIDEYIARATTEIQEMSNTVKATDLGILIERLYQMANDAEQKGDQKTASAILMNISKLKGLDQTTINHTFQRDPEHAKMSDAALEAAMAAAMQERH